MKAKTKTGVGFSQGSLQPYHERKNVQLQAHQIPFDETAQNPKNPNSYLKISSTGSKSFIVQYVFSQIPHSNVNSRSSEAMFSDVSSAEQFPALSKYSVNISMYRMNEF